MGSQRADDGRAPAQKRGRWPWDVKVAIGVAGLFAAHIGVILVQVCPY